MPRCGQIRLSFRRRLGSFRKADDFPVGVAIGSFRWPSLVALQIAVIRNTCGPVPDPREQ